MGDPFMGRILTPHQVGFIICKTMTFITTVVIRAEQWHFMNADDGSYWLQNGGKEPKPRGLRYPEDLSAEEVAIVEAAWKVVNAEKEERKKRNEMAYQRFKADQKQKYRRWSEGYAWVRYSVWHVANDHIWRSTGDGTQVLKFSELTNDEIAEVLNAKEREVKNRGVGGFFRRINRKLNESENE